MLIAWATAVSRQVEGNDTPGEAHQYPSFVGIDIDPVRISQAKQALQAAQSKGLIYTDVKVSFHCQNALEAAGDLMESVTVVFMYLIPRGLRLVTPLLQARRSQIRTIVTYMSPLPNLNDDDADNENYYACQRFTIPVPHQPDASWPLYVYTQDFGDRQQQLPESQHHATSSIRQAPEASTVRR